MPCHLPCPRSVAEGTLFPGPRTLESYGTPRGFSRVAADPDARNVHGAGARRRARAGGGRRSDENPVREARFATQSMVNCNCPIRVKLPANSAKLRSSATNSSSRPTIQACCFSFTITIPIGHLIILRRGARHEQPVSDFVKLSGVLETAANAPHPDARSRSRARAQIFKLYTDSCYGRCRIAIRPHVTLWDLHTPNTAARRVSGQTIDGKPSNTRSTGSRCARGGCSSSGRDSTRRGTGLRNFFSDWSRRMPEHVYAG